MTAIHVSGRLGGPELRATVHPVIIAYRRALQEAFEGTRFVGLDAVDYTIYVNGSLTEYRSQGGIFSSSYRAAKREFSMDFCVTVSEHDQLPGAMIAAALDTRFVDSAAVIAERLRRAGMQPDEERLASGFERAHALAAIATRRG